MHITKCTNLLWQIEQQDIFLEIHFLLTRQSMRTKRPTTNPYYRLAVYTSVCHLPVSQSGTNVRHQTSNITISLSVP